MCDALGISLFPHEEVLPARRTTTVCVVQPDFLANRVNPLYPEEAATRPTACLSGAVSQVLLAAKKNKRLNCAAWRAAPICGFVELRSDFIHAHQSSVVT